jgi:integrase/recombinase XerD
MPKRKAAPKGTFWRGDLLWGRVEIQGKDHKWSLRTDDPELAKNRFKEDRERLVAQAYYGPNRHAFADVLGAWAKAIGNNVAPTTVTRYGVSLGRLEHFLDGVFLDEINGVLIADIIRQRQAHGVTNATIKRDLVALSSVVGFAIDQGWCENNPVIPRMQRLKERRDPIILPQINEIARVIERAPGQFASLIAAAWKTGCRQDELVSARRSQLDDRRRELTVVGKGSKTRVVDLTPFDGYETFRALPVSIKGAHLFWHDQGEKYANASSRFACLIRGLKAKDPQFQGFRFHDLRHVHAVDWLKAGRSIYDLQHRLGHSSIKTTEVYLDFLTPEQVRAVKQQAGT